MTSVYEKYSKNPKGKVIRAKSTASGHTELQVVKAQYCESEKAEPKAVLMVREYEEVQGE